MKLMETKDIADICGVSIASVRRWIKTGALRAGVRPATNHFVIQEKDFDCFLEKHYYGERKKKGKKITSRGHPNNPRPE